MKMSENIMSGNGPEILAFEISYTGGAVCGNINHCSHLTTKQYAQK